MAIIYITGVEGSGKSTICKELMARGYAALDIDETGLSARYVKKTGERIKTLPPKDQLTAEWYDERERMLPASDIKRLGNQANRTLLFLCGVTENFDEIKDLFTKIICLTLDETTTIYRVTNRLHHGYGKTAVELSRILSNRAIYEQKNKDYGSTMIDASQSVSRVAEIIISNVSRELQRI